MFKKEVEDIMRQNGCRTHSGNFIQADKVCELIQKGAEFGYNKAKKDADKMKNRFLELCNLKDMRIEELEKANKWYYCKDELPKLKVGTTVSVIAVYLNAFDNPCKIDCFFNGRDFVYWDSSCTMWVKVSEFKGNVYAWKYADELPPKESE